MQIKLESFYFELAQIQSNKNSILVSILDGLRFNRIGIFHWPKIS